MKFNKDPRHQARRLLLNYIYANSFYNQEVELDYFCNVLQIKKFNNQLFSKILKNYNENNKQVNEQIAPLLTSWSSEQLLDLDLIIIKIAIIESLYLKITPHKVAVDEAVELSKEFGSEKSSKFVNGVLAKLINNS